MRASRRMAVAVVMLGLSLGLRQGVVAQTGSAGARVSKEMRMQHASGSFEVKITPVGEKDAVPGRMTIDKQFHGDLEGTSKGEMLTAMTTTKGSAGYVAIEEVHGTLAGRSGSFALQHNGTMTRGVPTLTVTVVPDSGTGELAGLSGQMTIDITDGKHAYRFDYSLEKQ